MIILSLGTNLGDKQRNLQLAIDSLEKVCSVKQVSSIHTSEAWGFESENSFCNIAVEVECDLTPEELLAQTQAIEIAIGRTTKSTNGYNDRLIDIDIIDYNGAKINSESLILPHQLMHQRAFVLEPLIEIAPDWIHPILNQTAETLLNKGEFQKL